MIQKPISDLGMIAALMTLGYSPIERQKSGNRVSFIFEWDDNLKAIENDYFSHNLMVDAATFQATIKSIKASIYQMENND